MTIDTATYIGQLNVALPADADFIGEGAAQIRVDKAAAKNSFPNVTGAVTKTHTELNKIVTTDGATLNGGLVFSDISYTVQWDMPTAANPVDISAVEYTDPVFVTTATGLRIGAAAVAVNFPPIPNLTAGFLVYNEEGDLAKNSGIQFIDRNPSTGAETIKASMGYVQEGSHVSFNNFATGGYIVLACQTGLGGHILLRDGNGNQTTLASLLARITALEAFH